jgi:signal transduction histidine kinase
MALVACALLVGVYFLVTTFIIRPLDEFTRAAQHVASATHGLQLPRARARELSLLAGALSTMTERLARDQADLQRKVHELEQARSQLEQTQAHLVRSERLASVGQLAAGLAHEIGNPLAALSGMQELMLEGGLEPEQQVDFLKRMRSETERISRIIRDLLDFARPTPLEGPQEADLEAVIAETVALVSHQPLLRKVQLALDVHPQLPRVKLGPAALTQVLLNLLLNAARACVDGGQVRVTANAWGDGARLVVEDEGQGVPPELRERIFEPFFSTREVGQGTGLGLSVCRGLVEAAGGRVWVEDAVPHGARFVVELRAADKRL